jgi:uridine kinase
MRISLADGTVHEAEPHTTLLDLMGRLNGHLDATQHDRIVGALVDNSVAGLSRPLTRDCRVQWLSPGTREGIRFIRRSLSFVLTKAAHDLFPGKRLVILHSLSKGFFCELHGLDKPLTRADVERVADRMRELVAAQLPFTPVEHTREDAIAVFEANQRADLATLFRYRTDSHVTLYQLDDMVDFYHGDLVPNTGYIGPFELRFYPPGFILRFPEDTRPADLPAFVDTRRLGQVFYEFKQWSRVLEVFSVGALNEVTAHGEINDFIRVAEALHEKKIAQIADAIASARDAVRLVLIAGPSASGKTTFAQRLAVQLRVNGLRPIPISLDDYYVERAQAPRDEHGDYDYENVTALDIALLNDHLQHLTWGDAVTLPRYDFKTGSRAPRAHPLQLRSGELLIVEGIHALNERLTESIPKDTKYKIYISALTQLNLDDHNRVPTTDTRLLRRIARDIQFRGYGVIDTISRWRAVRRGEDQFVFPFQEEADVMFNSGLFYELAVLRGIVEPLLLAVPPDVPQYTEARRLLNLLVNFLIVGTDEIPPNSILREFIGATCFFRAE